MEGGSKGWTKRLKEGEERKGPEGKIELKSNKKKGYRNRAAVFSIISF